MKKLITMLAISCLLAAGTALPVYGSGLDKLFSGIKGAILNGGQEDEPAPASASAGDTSQSEGPAPNSGDGVSDGSGQTSPYGPKKKP
ncbi:MAG: hypothetical protein HGA81_03045 [Chlorobium limicola]|uniref:Uncharacterized protein n=1 Tax=Chlorobium limicola (strain DSM 245 / NBRC 103803 / 6330) TaxID=290315 RepID=B3ECS0_CHLL2|nr:hypothetical protein [Chlorobium limicola]ACD90345.1 conserved hypothetical protein [Chlorobium limicola DSM 245]NTV07569.1 hypothetical protein [Chlorobium limicola]NTV21499.1 hypothetical protein [Chlorobium limicola]